MMVWQRTGLSGLNRSLVKTTGNCHVTATDCLLICVSKLAASGADLSAFSFVQLSAVVLRMPGCSVKRSFLSFVIIIASGFCCRRFPKSYHVTLVNGKKYWPSEPEDSRNVDFSRIQVKNLTSVADRLGLTLAALLSGCVAACGKAAHLGQRWAEGPPEMCLACIAEHCLALSVSLDIHITQVMSCAFLCNFHRVRPTHFRLNNLV